MTNAVPHIDLPDACLYATIERAARKFPDKVALELLGVNRVTYAQLMARADAFAAMLITQGVGPGDRVGYMAKNRVEVMDVFMGCSRIGAIFVPFVDSLRGNILKGMVELADFSLFITEEPCRAAVEEVWSGQSVFLPEPQAGDSPPWMREPAQVQWPALPPVEALSMFLYTSGTTGQSKGVMLTNGTVLHMSGSSNGMNGLTSDDVFFSALPAGHGNALLLTAVGALMLGATAVLVRRFSASRYEAELVESGATVTNLLGSMGNLLLKQEPSGVQVRTLKKAFVVPIAADVRRDIEARLHCKVYSGYGLADAGMPIWTGPEFPDGSCGRLLHESWEAKLLDESGREVAVGEPGELWLRSTQPFLSSQGYWRMPQATAARFRDRWIGTGDMFRRDKDGWYYFLDRAKDTIRRRGENVSSQEVESVILTHPRVVDCAVYAVPSEMSEDEVMVSVVLKPGPRLDALDLIKFIERKLPYFAVPRFVRFVAELPRTDTQKVQKTDLKKIAVTADTWDLEKSGYKVSR